MVHHAIWRGLVDALQLYSTSFLIWTEMEITELSSLQPELQDPLIQKEWEIAAGSLQQALNNIQLEPEESLATMQHELEVW